MKEAIKQLVDLLMGNADFTAVIPSGKLFPLVAVEGVGETYAIYIVGSEPITKDGRRYDFGLQLFFPPAEFTKMIEFTETVETLLEPVYDLGPTTTDVQVVKESVTGIFSTINFNTY